MVCRILTFIWSSGACPGFRLPKKRLKLISAKTGHVCLFGSFQQSGGPIIQIPSTRALVIIIRTPTKGLPIYRNSHMTSITRHLGNHRCTEEEPRYTLELQAAHSSSCSIIILSGWLSNLQHFGPKALVISAIMTSTLHSLVPLNLFYFVWSVI